jgi:hypothetical protein
MSDGNEIDLMKMATHTATGVGGAGSSASSCA